MAVHDHARILICARWGIGDLILQWPILEHVRRTAPAAHIVILAARPASRLLESAGLCDRLRTYQDFGIPHLGVATDPARQRVGRWLEAERIDAIADALSAPPAVQHAAWRAPVSHYETDRAALDAALRGGASASAALARGARAGWGLPPGIPPTPDLRRAVGLTGARRGGPAAAGRGSVPAIALVPFASHPLKRWPGERFHALGAALLEEGNRLAVFGAPGDTTAASVADGLDPAGVDLVPPADLRRTARMLADAAVCVGNDTGLLHLAAGVGTPAVGVFGPSDAAVYAPGGRSCLAASAGRPCPHRQRRSLTPPRCWRTGCLLGARSCIDDVSVEAVLEKVRRVAGGVARAPA